MIFRIGRMKCTWWINCKSASIYYTLFLSSPIAWHKMVMAYQACLLNKNFFPALVALMCLFFVKLQWHPYGLVAMLHPAYGIYLILPVYTIFHYLSYPWFRRNLSSYCSKSCWSFLPKSSNRICCSCSSSRRLEAHKAFLDDDWSLRRIHNQPYLVYKWSRDLLGKLLLIFLKFVQEYFPWGFFVFLINKLMDELNKIKMHQFQLYA